ncbi:hypothetical protein [Longimicrobium terrae]|jgi:hypothetical protein|uniref:Uncharacterized protein n=1 Tax=Longimicrobium terrae TaxID=1639882 RepID=A0A841GZE3_9BACT|nr:hypothetical protein [Longimicrobium terrae]MBB4636427.1 hypothetical protein [Longimicrobium terrae]MBB6071049.1 hypothetical protein [Longimicrobium terrae]NNC29070.1 hypothetical protein [Longimicrobium terrae]
MQPEPFDITPLDLSALALPARRHDRLSAAVLARARVGSAPRSPLVELAGWARPMLAAAAMVAAVSVGSLVWYARTPATLSEPLTVADALRIPAPVDAWVVDDRAPAEADLLAHWEDR